MSYTQKEEQFFFADQQFQIKHRVLKRIFDIAFSLIVLILFSWLFVTIALLVKFSSKGGIFYAHRRVGRAGKPFICYKFRTMHRNAEERLEELLRASPEAKLEWDTRHKLQNDPRVTSFGSFLRKCSLDELPQFWNVLRGDLSVVGPRPVVYAELVAHFREKATKILSIRPGLTGIWQVSGRSDTSYMQRVYLDEKYVDSCSLWLDLKLIAKTIPSLFFSKGAY